MSEADSPGAALRAARHAMGASVPEVAGSLKVSWAIIENIEAERFDALPASVFTRAYIRGYADLVGLDPDEMLWAYDQKTAPGKTTEIETRPLSALSKVLTAFSSGLLKIPRRQSWVFGGTVILIAVVSGLFLWFFWPSEAPKASAPVGQPNETSVGDAAPPVPSADEVSVESTVPADTSAPVSNDPIESVPNASIAQIETPVSGAVSMSVSDGSPARPADDPADDPPSVSVLNGSPGGAEDGSFPLSNPLTYVPGGDHVLVFHFAHDCWVQVFDAAGGMLHEDLERAKDELEVRGDAPFTITLGYAPGVHLEYNGESVMLAQHTYDNVAKLVLGL